MADGEKLKGTLEFKDDGIQASMSSCCADVRNIAYDKKLEGPQSAASDFLVSTSVLVFDK